MKITYIHHSAFLVETESAYLLFDYFQGKLPEFSDAAAGIKNCELVEYRFE